MPEGLAHEWLLPGRLGIAFQPIVRLSTGEVYGYEVLGRAHGDEPPGPSTLVALAHAEGWLRQLDEAWRNIAVATIAERHRDDETCFFLNVDPRASDDPGFDVDHVRALVDAHGLHPRRFVLELTEPGAVLDSDRLAAHVRACAAHGFAIAIDDLGAGYASLHALLRLRPHLVKLDMTVVHGIADDPLRLHLVRALAEFARNAGMPLIAEGIEDEATLLRLLRAGVVLGQGYFIARPSLRAEPPSMSVRMRLRALGEMAKLEAPSVSKTVVVEPASRRAKYVG
jgi:EAL domain-containing protein (putative c-di-GMP-specific phosphodiesterase class I)